MKILLTGVTGYVGKRILPVLIEKGHEVVCCVREKRRLTLHQKLLEKVSIIEIDFLHDLLPDAIPADIDAAYYLIHSMTTSQAKFDELETRAAQNFKKYIESTAAT
ncbi:MAG TPA: NAD-dependent epimerase/dehydratase family protein, partial [Draconibacterium sp.]|nr:NAD-dependent epimerase/dehydratase family protein [Draconibacterium sp.]